MSISQKQILKKTSLSISPKSYPNINIKDNQNKPIIKKNELPLPHFNTLDSSFISTMEQLVSNDKTIREKAAEKAKKYLHISFSNSEELYQKISRSLFYFFWNTDKPAYQLSMAKFIASFIYVNPDEKNKLIPKSRLWISTFLTEMSKKFQSIDVLRLDKYIMMIDQVMSTYLNACLENKLFKSTIYLIDYFIKESENNNNNFNFTFESNKIKVISRFVKLILNSDDKIEGNIKNRELYLNNEENGFATFYKKLLFFYKSMKDKRQIKNFQEKIFQIIIDGLNENKKQKKNLELINKIEEINKNFMKDYKNEMSKKNLNLEYFLNKINGEILDDTLNKDKDQENEYFMKIKYLQKIGRYKEETKRDKLEKMKNKNLKIDINDNENIEKNKNDGDNKNENKNNKNKSSGKKEKLDKFKNFYEEINLDDIKLEKQIINLNEEDEEKKDYKQEKKQEKQLSSNKDNINLLNSNKKNKKDINNVLEDINNKKESTIKMDKIKNDIEQKSLSPKNKIEKNKNNFNDSSNNKISQKKSSSSGDDDCLIEDSDENEEESEELIEENDDDDSSENPSSLNNSNIKNKEKEKNSGEIYSDEALDRYSKELMEEEEEEFEEEDDDEEYELNENDLDNLADDMNLIMGNYNDETTLKNTKLNMKKGLLNKKTMRNLKNERSNTLNNDKNKKKKITFSLENNVVSLYNSKIPISLKSKKKNVFVSGGTNRQSILKK